MCCYGSTTLESSSSRKELVSPNNLCTGESVLLLEAGHQEDRCLEQLSVCTVSLLQCCVSLSVCLFVRPWVSCLSVCLSVYVSVCLSVCVSGHMSVCQSDCLCGRKCGGCCVGNTCVVTFLPSSLPRSSVVIHDVTLALSQFSHCCP